MKTLTTTITALSHEGRGIAHEQGKTLFIENALPGELVRAEIARPHATFDEGIAVEIIHPSPDRVTPPCPHYLVCGGCSLQHLHPTAQIRFKENILKEQLQHIGHCQPENMLPPLQTETLQYRRKARLGVKYVAKKNKVLVGFREKNGRYIADLTTCPVLHPVFGEKLEHLSALIKGLSGFQQIPQVECAMGDDEAALILRHLSPLTESDNAQLIAFSQKHHIAIYTQAKGLDTIKKLWPEDSQPLLHYTLPNDSLTLAFHPTDFTQVNLSIN